MVIKGQELVQIHEKRYETYFFPDMNDIEKWWLKKGWLGFTLTVMSPCESSLCVGFL